MTDDQPYRDGRIHVHEEKCTTCVFRPGNLMHLPPGRLQALIEANLEDNSALRCHQTLAETRWQYPTARAAVCRGFFDAYADRSASLRLAIDWGLITEVPIPTNDNDNENHSQKARTP